MLTTSQVCFALKNVTYPPLYTFFSLDRGCIKQKLLNYPAFSKPGLFSAVSKKYTRTEASSKKIGMASKKNGIGK